MRQHETSFVVAQNISVGGALTKKGAGTLVLSGTNTCTGGTQIDSGVLAILEDANLGQATGNILIGDATLRLDDSFDTAATSASPMPVVRLTFLTTVQIRSPAWSAEPVLNKGGTIIKAGILQVSI
ncbi:autotransporter-associated beta strand repeat-containing protein [Brucella sp. LJL56]